MAIDKIDVTKGIIGTLPVANGGTALTSGFVNGGVNTPSFWAGRTATQSSISSGTATKVQFSTEAWDSDGNYDSSTNYRFTPTTAGKYFYSAGIQCYAASGVNNNSRMYLQLYKNGSSLVRDATQASMSGGNSFPSAMIVGYILQMNGSSDYVEGYIYQDHGSNRDVRFGSETHFSGFRIAGV